MNKAELVQGAARVLADNNARKNVHLEKRVLKITDVTYKDEVNAGCVSVKAKDKLVKYTIDDVAVIFEAIIAVIGDAIAHGETISINGLGKFYLKHRPARRMKRPDNGQWVDLPERYVPKITPGFNLRDAAAIYSMSMQNNPEGLILPDPIYDQFEFPDEEPEGGEEISGNAEAED